MTAKVDSDNIYGLTAANLSVNYTIGDNISAAKVCEMFRMKTGGRDADLHEIVKTKVLLAICALGLFGNLLNLVILTRRGLEKSMHQLDRCSHIGLVALSASDLLFCIVCIPEALYASETSLYTKQSLEFYVNMYGDAVTNVFITSSTWLTVVVALGRYLAICYPLRVRYLLNVKVVKIQLIIVFVISVLFNLPRLWSFDELLMPCPDGSAIHAIMSGPLHERAYLWAYFTVGILVPLIIMAVCNINLIRTLRASIIARNEMCDPTYTHTHAEASRRITRTLALILMFYILLVTPADLVFVAKDIVGTSYFKQYNLIATILQLIQALNFAINVILYCAVNSYFRQSLKAFFTLCCRNNTADNCTDENVTLQNITTKTTKGMRMPTMV